VILVDTNVLLDIVGDDPYWFEWSISALDDAQLRAPLFINDVVYAELSVRYDSIVHVDEFLSGAGIGVAEMPRAALFLAGKAYARYKASGGARPSVLPDFFIGAHAATLRTPLITRDTKRYRTYFPTVELIAPPG
jgi:predicted nucleic acid-binding protein